MKTNRPDISRLDKFKMSFDAFQHRHNLHLPHPLKKWKAIDPRVKNFIGASTLALPGFLAVVAGGSQFISTNDQVQACRNTPPIREGDALVCKALQSDRSQSVLLAISGGIELGAAGLAGVYNDGRLMHRQQTSRSPSRQTLSSR